MGENVSELDYGGRQSHCLVHTTGRTRTWISSKDVSKEF